MSESTSKINPAQEVEDRAHALAAGFNLYVPKPLQPDELITAIANLADTSCESV